MKIVVQRVSQASVEVDKKVVGRIDQGLLLLAAIHKDDQEEVLAKMAKKILALRIFGDEQGKMNKSAAEAGAELLAVSQFTLYGSTAKGNRPSFIDSAGPDKALPFFNKFVEILKDSGLKTETGEFGADMKVSLVNDGPVTIILSA